VSRLYGGPSQTNLRIDLTYDGNNQIASMTRYSDLTGSTRVAFTTYLYDAANRVTSLIHRKGSDSSNIGNYTYTYDAGSRVTTEVKNGATITYTYDATNQLTADGTKTFTYDGAGNRTNAGYTTGSANQLTSDGVWTYTYDAEGNLTKKSKGALAETWTYGYDTRNELTSAKHSATDGGAVNLEVDYKYDAWGNRVEKDYYLTGPNGSETITRFSYDGWKTGPQKGFVGLENFDIWADLDGNNGNALQTRYLRGNVIDQLFARLVSDGTAYWELTDRQGTIRDVTDGSGVVKDTITYDGWGQITNDTNMSLRGRYGYTGREEDVETGWQHNRARYYDAVNARWITQDPLGFDAGDCNLYRYAANGPSRALDPSGAELLVIGNSAAAAVSKVFTPGRYSDKVFLGDLCGSIPLWYFRPRILAPISGQPPPATTWLQAASNAEKYWNCNVVVYYPQKSNDLKWKSFDASHLPIAESTLVFKSNMLAFGFYQALHGVRPSFSGSVTARYKERFWQTTDQSGCLLTHGFVDASDGVKRETYSWELNAWDQNNRYDRSWFSWQPINNWATISGVSWEAVHLVAQWRSSQDNGANYYSSLLFYPCYRGAMRFLKDLRLLVPSSQLTTSPNVAIYMNVSQ
jgi:RHS repeat-associated protein